MTPRIPLALLSAAILTAALGGALALASPRPSPIPKPQPYELSAEVAPSTVRVDPLNPTPRSTNP